MIGRKLLGLLMVLVIVSLPLAGCAGEKGDASKVDKLTIIWAQ